MCINCVSILNGNWKPSIMFLISYFTKMFDKELYSNNHFQRNWFLLLFFLPSLAVSTKPLPLPNVTAISVILYLFSFHGVKRLKEKQICAICCTLYTKPFKLKSGNIEFGSDFVK